MSRFRKFEIKKGRHTLPFYRRFKPTFSNTIEFECYFDSSCLYEIMDHDKTDINKLHGFSNSLNPLKQSARIGWRCVDHENIQIFSYVHNEGKPLVETVLGHVKPNEVFKAKIVDTGDQYSFTTIIDENINYVLVDKPKTKNLFYLTLFFYFGGNKVAPQVMKVFIKDL